MEAARAGGAVALEHYRRGFSVSLKADHYGSTVFASNGLLHDAALAAMRDRA